MSIRTLFLSRFVPVLEAHNGTVENAQKKVCYRCGVISTDGGLIRIDL
jgi:hypothetical protein